MNNNIDELKEKLNNAFSNADIISQYSLFEDKGCMHFIRLNINNRLMIDDFGTPYLISDIQQIMVMEESNKTSMMVKISFPDDVAITFHKYGISLDMDGINYHTSRSVLGRLHYCYKNKICGEKINPLIIKDHEVIAYCGKADYVCIPEGVKKLGDSAFENSLIERIHLPQSLNEICNYCFRDCKKLSVIKFNEEDEYIDLEIFNKSFREKEVIFPDNIKKIGKYSFMGCDKLPYIKPRG
jgi:hypothetical protein